MVAAATLLNCEMTTAPTTSLINNNDWQQHCLRNSTMQTNLPNNHNNGEQNGQQQQQQSQKNDTTDIEEIDCNALLDSYDGETSNNSADWKAFRWTPESTRLMLRLRFERQIEFQLRNRQKKDLWSEIAVEMRREGNFFTTGEVCDLKYRNMLQTYKKNYLKEERGMQSQIVWEYYDIFKEAMKACAGAVDELVPSQLCESVCNTSDQIFGEVKKENCIDNDDDVSECVETNNNNNNKDISNEDENQIKTTVNNTPRRRAPSARVMANNYKRYRLASSNSQTENAANEYDWSHLPPLEPKPDNVAATNTNIRTVIPSPPQQQQQLPQHQQQPTAAPTPPQNYITAHNNSHVSHSHGYPPAPPWLTESELREYFSYGESVGLQIAHIRDPRTRAFLQLKIQESLFMAKIGRLTEYSQN